jgi:hypothetical protein
MKYKIGQKLKLRANLVPVKIINHRDGFYILESSVTGKLIGKRREDELVPLDWRPAKRKKSGPSAEFIKDINAVLAKHGWILQLGDTVEKPLKANWSGEVTGIYFGKFTDEGYAVESDKHEGVVQIYPVKALNKTDA